MSRKNYCFVRRCGHQRGSVVLSAFRQLAIPVLVDLQIATDDRQFP